MHKIQVKSSDASLKECVYLRQLGSVEWLVALQQLSRQVAILSVHVLQGCKWDNKEENDIA